MFSNALRAFKLDFKMIVGIAWLALATGASAQWSGAQDSNFITDFKAYYGQPSNAYPTVEAYNAAIRLDRFFASTDASIVQMKNDQYFPSSFSSWMEGFNEAYRATGDVRYIRETLKIAREVIAFRDDRRNPPRELATGEIVPCWSSPLYSYGFGNRTYAVDTGMALQPIFDLLLLATQESALMAEFQPGEYAQMLQDATEVLEFHDSEYRSGPEAGVGTYVFTQQRNPYEYNYFSGEYPQPINWSSAMARAFWVSWKITGNTAHRDRALQIGQYFKNRLVLGTDGGYYWRYYLSIARVPVDAPAQAKDVISYGSFGIEDISHAGLTVSIAFDLAIDGEIFNARDVDRFSQTILNGFARLGGGVMTYAINGDPTHAPGLAHTCSAWMRIVPLRKEVFAPLAAYYLKYWHSNGPLDGGMLLRGNQIVNAQTAARTWSCYP